MKSNEIKTKKDIDDYIVKSEIKKIAKQARQEKAIYVSRVVRLVMLIVVLFFAGLYEPFRVEIANIANELAHEDSGLYIVAGAFALFPLTRTILENRAKV